MIGTPHLAHTDPTARSMVAALVARWLGPYLIPSRQGGHRLDGLPRPCQNDVPHTSQLLSGIDLTSARFYSIC
jgi:hypothetical protein